MGITKWCCLYTIKEHLTKLEGAQKMDWILVVGIALAALFLVEFIIICPDKLPWRRRKK